MAEGPVSTAPLNSWMISSQTLSISLRARHGTVTVIETLQDVLAKRQLAYDRDPDPQDDAVEEIEE